MIVISKILDMQTMIKEYRQKGMSIGFVPTMGFLHEGHISLMKHARPQNDIVVASIFVNPLQFGPNEDFDSYPRDIDRDEKMASDAQVDILFYPDVHEMYNSAMSTTVVVNDRVNVLCGKSRPGHFDGVATVLTKLFNIVSPDNVYFGMKDAQQVAVVDGLIKDFNFPINIVPIETVREANGLAKSSRNVRLTNIERQQAPYLYKSLQLAKERIKLGEKDPNTIIALITDYIDTHTDGNIDYVELYSYPKLTALSKISGNIIIAIAVKFTEVRLIDNITMEVCKEE
ncbi:pantoate--beta-alanine ligase [Cytobacillus sp. IB215665]|uniref:pantoate--beta-alanine ligase n=1 Tax=Cytobacillus sp. IB215665 TaxID=3097357 RepID=UPI002A0C105C|nr:pantoate--beta-alanine ligase [Cytobacillus sp. IB215665]MDX8366464.1 pantoate--beta-alanine ligase [Cytobacillus sp. IB215665]